MALTKATTDVIQSVANTAITGNIESSQIADSSVTTAKLADSSATPAKGGTGQNFSTTAQGSTLYFSGTGTVAALAPGTSGQFLKTQGTGANPTWTDVTTTITGEIRMWSTPYAPSGWLECDGSAVSRSTYSALYAVISTAYGSGDGSTTFNLPDMRSRSPVGRGQGSGLTLRSWAQSGGAETHTLTTSEMPSHKHIAQRTLGAGSGGHGIHIDTATTQQLNDAVINNEGGGGSHNNMHPFLVLTFIIKT